VRPTIGSKNCWDQLNIAKFVDNILQKNGQ